MHVFQTVSPVIPSDRSLNVRHLGIDCNTHLNVLVIRPPAHQEDMIKIEALFPSALPYTIVRSE